MKFIYEDNRNERQQSLMRTSIGDQWWIDDVFTNKSSVSDSGTERSRLKWAPVLASLAFGEGTAFYGFGRRIHEADDISTRTWLATHLLDEAKHTEGFSRLLDYLYPSTVGQQQKLLKSKDVYVFYGHTERAPSLLNWLVCTQIAEIFGKHCYMALKNSLSEDPIASLFFSKILQDEGRHIGYINELIALKLIECSANDLDALKSFTLHMMKLSRNMFEAKRRGANYRSFVDSGIDVTRFCDHAESEIWRRLFTDSEDQKCKN